MDTFLAVAFSFPTVIFSVLLCVAIVYWLISLVGLGDIEADGDIDASGDFSGLMVTLGLQGVPLPLVLTLLFLCSWLVSYFTVLLWGALVPAGFLYWLFGFAVLAAALIISVLVTAMLVRPLRPLFRRAYLPPLQKRIIGTACVVISATVTETKGRAEAVLDGAHLVLQVRSHTPLSHRERAVLIEHIPDKNAWWVVPESEFLAGDSAG
ncbi:hypothetical protein KUV44_10595 [Marinobacter daepoensis]|uniref:Ubiquinone biosynthesis protein UbiH n=1 Tax=Marinobacter daepoensis TaxID=262077 RepID=A0ABS3BFP2_9GAMM|nr:hypothetical protein [Marinobacter daepoensis]MBN7770140.1 hypothetical protein [Marinobacter daepoensis]MBY6033670.1 hypothetical protein [Marinobacter daepoensis]MBY6079586.1 hypothetical protein [Marinobacter daepoensis]